MYLIRFLLNFAVFCVFLWISRLRSCSKYQKTCTYELRHFHFTNWRLKICIWRLYFSGWSPKGDLTFFLISSPDYQSWKGSERWGDTPLYKPYRHVPPQRVGFLGLLGLKTICSFGSGIGYGFRGNYGSVHVWTYISFPFHMNNNKREICEFEKRLKNSCFSLRSNLVMIT